MGKEDAWDAVYNRLDTLADIQKIYNGYIDVDSIPHSHFPCIIMDPVYSEAEESFSDSEDTSYNNEVFWIDLFVLFKIYQKDKQVTGTDAIDGALDWEETVRNKLCDEPRHLNEEVVRVMFGRTNYLRSSPEIPKQDQLRVVHIELGLRLKVCIDIV